MPKQDISRPCGQCWSLFRAPSSEVYALRGRPRRTAADFESGVRRPVILLFFRYVTKGVVYEPRKIVIPGIFGNAQGQRSVSFWKK